MLERIFHMTGAYDHRHVFESGPKPDLTPVPRKHPDDL